MSAFVFEQFFEFMVLLYGGLVAAFIYDILKLYQRKFKPGSLFIAFQDILYWIMTTSMVIYLLYYSSLGQLKGYMAMAFITGCLLYHWVLSEMIQKTIIILVRKGLKLMEILKKLNILPIKNIAKSKKKKEEI